MSGSLNMVQIIGNLGRDPDIRTTQSGGKVCNLRVATSQTWKDRQTGERHEKTEWHTVSVFNDGLVRVCEQYLRKGSKIYVCGQLQTKKWQDQSGNDRYSTDVVLQGFNSSLTMLDGKSDNGGQSQGGYGGGANPNSGRGLDDEIPFNYNYLG